jgi:DNA processing protein
MAVPGAVLSGRNRGAHALLRDGANVVEEARDVIELLQADWRREFEHPPAVSPGSDPAGPAPDPSTPATAAGRDPILRLMRPGETYRLEDLAAETSLAPVALMARLTRLEVGGWVLRVEGGRFVMAGANVLR